MAATLKLKETSGSTLWDCLDTTGATNPGSVACNIRHLGWASREPQVTLIESDTRDGGWMGRSRQGLKSSTHVLHLSAASKDDLLQGYNAFTSYLADGRGKYWEYKLNSASDTLYLDFTHGWTEALIRDEDSGFDVEVDVKARTLPFTIVHQPLFRLDEIDAALNKLTNATLLCDENNDGRPNDWTWSDVTLVTAETISNGWSHRTISTTNVRDFSQLWSGAVPGDIFTGSFEAYTDNATNGRVVARVRFWDATSVLATHMSTDTVPSTDPDNFTIVFKTTTAAPAGTTRAEMVLRSSNLTAAPIVHSWRNANLSRTTTVPPFRSGVEIVSNDPASTTVGRRARALPIVIQSDGPVRARLKLEGNGSTFGFPARVAVLPLSAPADSYKWLNRRKYENLAGASLFNSTSAVADANGSGAGSNTIESTFGTTNNLTDNRMNLNITTDLTALRGKWMLMLRCRGTVALDDFSVLVKWGTNSPTHSMPIKSLPNLSTSFQDYPIGTFNLLDDADPYRLSFNMYVRRDAGTGNFRGNIFSFVPCDQLATLSGPFGAALLGTTDYAVSDPEMGATEILNSSSQFLDFAEISGTTPFILQPGLSMIYLADDQFLNTVKASVVYEPTRHA